MSEVDECLKLAASSSKIAEAHLKDAEDELHTLGEKLENCLELMKKLPRDELLFWEQFDASVHDIQRIDLKELHLVSSWESGAL